MIDPFAEEPIPDPDAYIDAVFGESGYLAARFAGYQQRAGQVALARAVDGAIAGTKHLMAEGPTGTGKSIGYAVPATYHAAMYGRRVIIVTANIALQEQLVQKDLPLLTEILPWGFSFASLKGRSNYLCVDRMYAAEGERLAQLGRGSWDRNAFEEEQLDAVKAWAAETKTGDVSELDFVPEASVWRQFSRSSDECKGNACRSFEDCFAYEAKRIARASTVIVTNYHMLFAHVVVRRVTGRNFILPGFDVAILDEAHKASDIARDFFGFKVNGGQIARLSRELEKLKADDSALSLGRKLRTASENFFAAVADYKRRCNYRVRLKEKLGEHDLVARHWPILEQALDLTAQIFRGLTQRCGSSNRDAAAGYSKTARKAAEIRTCLEDAVNLEDDEAVVYFLDEEKYRGELKLTIGSKPISVANVIRDELFDGKPAAEVDEGRRYRGYDDESDAPDADAARERMLRDRRTVICTSATLSTSGTFDFISGELGCPDGYDGIIAESPFDWPNQCLFIIPEGLPDPSKEREEFAKAVPGYVERAVEFAGGRTLALFTSYKALDASFQRLKARAGSGVTSYTAAGHRLLKQGEMPRTKLVDVFRTDVSSVLLGTESFWAGVDVPGEALSCVVIDKIPFATPDDPVLDAIAARDKSWFFNYSVPRAIIQLKQGFGRLIRSSGDKGVVVLLDPRIIEKPSYGGKFLRSLPPVSRSRKLEHIAQFLPQPPPAPEQLDDDIAF